MWWFEGSRRSDPGQSTSYGKENKPVQTTRITKPYLCFCRMHIYINMRKRDVQL